MKKRIALSIFFLGLCLYGFSQSALKIALLKYRGGGDWYANPTSLSNLSSYCNKELKMNFNSDYATVEVGSRENI